MPRRLLLLPALLAALFLLGANESCPAPEQDPKPKKDPVATTTTTTTTAEADPAAPGKKVVLKALAAEKAPAASPRSKSPILDEMDTRITTYFAGQQNQRVYVQVDKPIYKPGETIWLRIWDLQAKDLSAVASGTSTLELISPKGASVIKKGVSTTNGYATNDLELPPDVLGGEYKIRATAPDGRTMGERPIVVSRYEPPRMKKKLEFVRKAYGAGDVVSATFELKRPTGEPMKDQALTAVLRLDGNELPRVSAKTNSEGGAMIKVQLPPAIELGDGLLTILVDDGGITESISKAVPIVMKRMQLSFFPEGGKLVTGLESRVYFEAKTALGKPADVEGNVVDDQGQLVAQFKSYKEGLGRFAFIPATGRRYKAEITKPEGIIDQVQLPISLEDGCVLRTYDDVDGERAALMAGVTCTTNKQVFVTATVRDNLLDKAALDVKAGKIAVVALEAPSTSPLHDAMGVARVTLFDDAKLPLAERIVFRNRRARLDVKVQAHKDHYSPRDQVTLAITTTDGKGKAVPADLALSIVDDTVISFADDKTGHMLSRVYLEPELPGVVEEPNLFFDLTEEKSALALELLVGTRGWRTFEWRPVFSPPVPLPSSPMGGGARKGGGRFAKEGEREGAFDGVPMPAPPMPVAPMAVAPPPGMMAPPMVAPVDPAPDVEKAEPAKNIAQAEAPPADAPAPIEEMQAKDRGEMAERKMEMKEDPEWGRAAGKKAKMDRRGDDDEEMPARQRLVMAPVRVFPAPVYGGTTVPAVRTDFRETIHWVPQVRTGKDGTATVAFYLSDAVTSFRVFSEGAGGGRAGREETVLDSKLPFSMSVKLPLEVSAGDKILVPLTLTNEVDDKIDVDVKATFGSMVTVKGDVGGTKTLKKNARDSMFYDLDVTGISGTSKVSFSAAGSGLKDEFERELVVVPRGFPIEQGFAGTVKDKVSHTVDTGEAIDGTIEGVVRFYPSPTATLISGLDGMLQEPSGCFEQTSSTNYPNIMILTYLEKNNVAAPDISARAHRLLDSGYKKLTGFETAEKGYEWFGGAPGHEALSAYGLLEFQDMKAVYGDVDGAMVTRTGEWLKKRRDGKGGYKRNDRALDSFGGASPEVTNAYITYALSEAKTKGIDDEIAAEQQRAASTSDAYELALATNTMFNAGKTSEGEAAAKKLAAMQDASGAWLKANHSITRSGGENLQIETTALSILALLKANGQYPDNTRKGIEWMMKHRGSYGQWGATQATVLSLKAFLAYIDATKKTQGPGSVIVQVNGKVLKSINYDAGHKDPIIIDGLGKLMTKGKNEVRLLVDGKDALPYTLGVTFHSNRPATSPDAVVDLKITLDKKTAKMGEAVRGTAVVKNKTTTGQPMTLARIGIPGGLVYQDWQLKKLREDKKIAFYETRAREVILYFRDLGPSEEKQIPIDLIAQVPGSYEGPASSAYLYYTDEHKTWADPLKMEITR
ncbi:MAG: MG2 domain-containing protein [Deltaproteobacteria bacterium]|nr:MG2 domain-containing protein [Deltaproteobacteria bacterium]